MFKKFSQKVWEIIKFALISAAIILPVRTFIAQPFIVSGASMHPTFEDREYLIVDELSYHFRTPKRGEIIVFRYPKEPRKYFIKRVIGLPGETVTIKKGLVTIKTAEGEQFVLKESYAHGDLGRSQTIVLAEDKYFVMGDNRPLSLDSRSWGPLEAKFIKGRAIIRLFPFNRIAFLPGTIKSEE